MVLFVRRPEYYRMYQHERGNDLHGKAQIIIAKHRKGATGDVLLTFQGQYTRFMNPEDAQLAPLPGDMNGGEFIGSKMNQDYGGAPETDSFAADLPAGMPPDTGGPAPF